MQTTPTTHTITRMEPQTRRPDRYNVWLDGRFAFALDGALAMAEGLAVGSTLTDGDLARLTVEEEERSLYDAALRFLAARPRSRAEVKRRLLRPQAGKPTASDATERAAKAEQVERTLDRLADAGLLDDDAFAAFWAEQRERFSPRSARAITQELRQHGVDSATAAQATDANHDAEQAMRAARQRLHSMRADDYSTFRTRLGGFLQRRGFGYGVMAQVVRDLWAETHPDGAPDEDFDATDAQGEVGDE
ncbi:MAG TPA: regulatory protein RecX [Ktedonobacterales bacterium]|nr:regulatory protein RecX [Ktedonobacterales bacterium]